MPTVNTSTVGATGRDFSTWSSWEAATDNNLVGSDTQEIGEGYDDAVFASDSNLTFSGATADATRNRIARSAVGQEYDPITDTGCLIQPNTTFNVVTEAFFTAERIGLRRQTFANSIWATLNTSSTVTLDGMTFVYDNASDALGNNGVIATLAGARIRNCLYFNDDTGRFGFFCNSFAAGAVYQNCVGVGARLDIYEMSNHANTLTNCYGGDAGGQDFDTIGNATVTFCCSSDDTADDNGGAGNSINQAVATVFENAAPDFTPAVGEDLDDGGTDLSGTFANDLANNPHGSNGTWEKGVYDLEVFDPLQAVETTVELSEEVGAVLTAARPQGYRRGSSS